MHILLQNYDYKQNLRVFFFWLGFGKKSQKCAGAHVEERRSFEIPRSATGAPLPKILKAGAQAGAPLLKNLRSPSQR